MARDGTESPNKVPTGRSGSVRVIPSPFNGSDLVEMPHAE